MADSRLGLEKMLRIYFRSILAFTTQQLSLANAALGRGAGFCRGPIPAKHPTAYEPVCGELLIFDTNQQFEHTR